MGGAKSTSPGFSEKNATADEGLPGHFRDSKEDSGQAGALKDWGAWEEGYTSEITRVESLRALDRLRLEGRLDDDEVAEKMQHLREVLETTGLIALNGAILERASQSHPTVLGTLDAIHLASALFYIEEKEEGLLLLTHDRRQGTAARALGLETRGLDWDPR